ncbi:MAG: CapA family protein [Candidatus Bathyarchaeia archaeon]|jgi:poly-gamma-glutamate synthesis protein (capsule biosynthesis protein)
MKDLRLLCVGDAFIARRIGVYGGEADVAPLFKRIRNADVSFINLEIAIHSYEGYPIGEGKYDAYGQADPVVADDLKEIGFDICSCANNHAMDYSEGGLRTTISNLDRVGLAHSGSGINLAEAREPAFLDTPKGVISLVSACTWDLGVASHQRKNLPGRPGINPLHLDTVYHLKPQHWDQFKEIVGALDHAADIFVAEPKLIRFPDRETKFLKGEETRREYVPRKVDVEGNLRAVSDARSLSDWSFFSLHDHCMGVHAAKGYRNLDLPPDEVRDFAHKVIDVGADAYLGHGPHVMRGIEIYKGKPIFYSLGNFVFQSTLIRRQPSDLFDLWGLTGERSTVELYEKREAPPAVFFDDPSYWESFIAEVDYEEGKLSEIRLIPIILDYDQKKPLSEQRTTAGVPRLARGKQAKKIIEDLAHLSSLYGTEVNYREGAGILAL